MSFVNNLCVDDENQELPNGYATESGKLLLEANSKEFIVDDTGNANLGSIGEIVEQQTDGIVKAAPVRLQVGTINSRLEGFGFLHINKKHGKQIKQKGYPNVIQYIKHILENFTQIYSQGDENRFILYCVDDSKGFMPMDLEFRHEKDGYYTVVTAYPRRQKNIGALLYDGGARPSAVVANGTLKAATDNLSDISTESANAKSNTPASQNISQEQHEVKPDKLTDSCEKLMPTESFVSAREAFSHYVKMMQGDDDKAYIEATAKVMKSSFKPSRFVLFCADKSKGFMPIDLEFERDKDGYYTIISAMPHGKK